MYNKNTEKEQMFLKRKGDIFDTMREVSNEIKVLAVFEKSNPPMPCKFKLVDTQGEEHTINIDKITRIDTVRLQFVDYYCETYFNNVARRYLLKYWKESFKWNLFVE